jgi:hypothetical protein
MTEPAELGSPIEDYLDGIVDAGRQGDPRQLRYLLAETEAHLRDSAAVAQASGLSAAAAEADAVARFGPASAVCRADEVRSRPSYRELLRQSMWSVVLLGGIGAAAVGVSGVLAALLRAVGGDRLVTAVAPGQVLGVADCARWLAADPNAASCRAAALSDWAAEAVYYRLAVGVLGLLMLTVLAWGWRRRDPATRTRALLPGLTLDTAAFILFLLAGVWTLGSGIDAVVVAGGDGSGQWFSAAPVALAAAIGFGWRMLHDLRSPSQQDPPARGRTVPA